MMVSEFDENIYERLKRVPKGMVTTYKELAHSVGTRAYRAVGSAMRKNPLAPAVPCHRVVASDGGIGGFKGQTKGDAIFEKIRLLEKEGIKIKDNKIVDFEKRMYRFKT